MGVNIQTIKDIRLYIARELDEIYPESEINAITNVIIKTVTGLSGLHLLYSSEQKINPGHEKRIIEICKELKSGKPVQYILGETIFYDCIIKVNSSTLIPRPETEELVHLILNENNGFRGGIVDFGTGSGCIAIALAANLPGAAVTGIDISEGAVNTAKENALLNKVSVSFVKGDIFNFDYNSISKADLIVSNPPYVRTSEKQFMSKNVLDFEPHSALFVNDDEPLIYYKRIVGIANTILVAGGRLYFEINEALGHNMIRLLSSSGYSDVQVVKDLNNKDRIIKGTKNG